MNIDELSETLQAQHGEDFSKFAISMIIRLTEAAIAYGKLDLTGLDEQEALDAAMDFINEYVGLEGALDKPIIDHRSDILRYARQLAIDEKYDYSLMHYAIWWEHWINSLLHSLLYRKGICDKEFNEIISSLNNRAKSSWFLKLLDLPEIKPEHLKTIAQVAQKRNELVHYKYPVGDFSKENALSKAKLISKMEITVKWLQKYEQEHIFGNCKLFGLNGL